MGLSSGHICGYAIKTKDLKFDINRLVELGFDNDDIEELVTDNNDLRNEILENNETMLGIKYHYSEDIEPWISVPIEYILNDPEAKFWAIGHMKQVVEGYIKKRGIINPEDFEFQSFSYFK